MFLVFKINHVVTERNSIILFFQLITVARKFSHILENLQKVLQLVGTEEKANKIYLQSHVYKSILFLYLLTLRVINYWKIYFLNLF